MKKIILFILISLTLYADASKSNQPKLKYYIECGEESKMDEIVKRAEAAYTTMQRKAYAIASEIQINTGSISDPNAPDVPRICAHFWWYE